MKALLNTPKPRKYQVPEGLVDRVLYLYDTYQKTRMQQTRREMWKIIENRCPEVRQGRWEIHIHGSAVFVEEVIA